MRFLPALGVLLALAPSAALAQAATTTSDARCLLSMVAFSSVSKEPDAKEVGKMAVMYYASRITLREPNYDFAAQLRQLEKTMDGPTLQAEAMRCGPPALEVLKSLSVAFAASTPPPAATPSKP
jgi:hypothetical protein